MLKTIYNLEPTYKVCPDVGVCNVWLTFKGKTYRGLAELSPEDKDFFSEKVGLNIALSRARIKLLKDLVHQAKITYTIKRQMYLETVGYGNSENNYVDPTGMFLNKVIQAKKRHKSLREALRKEQKYLAKYLENQDKMVEYIKIHRSQGKTK